MTIILDSNLLLLLIVGYTSTVYIQKHKRLKSYTGDDFELLKDILDHATNIVVTPNTLTETSNLAGHIADPARAEIYAVFRAFVGDAGVEECFVQSKVAVTRTEFVRLGLTDSALLHIATESRKLLTADVALYLAALHLGLDAVNFNHYRDL